MAYCLCRLWCWIAYCVRAHALAFRPECGLSGLIVLHLSWTWSLLVFLLGWLTSECEPSGPFCLCPLEQWVTGVPRHACFPIGAGDQNSSPHAGTISGVTIHWVIRLAKLFGFVIFVCVWKFIYKVSLSKRLQEIKHQNLFHKTIGFAFIPYQKKFFYVLFENISVL